MDLELERGKKLQESEHYVLYEVKSKGLVIGNISLDKSIPLKDIKHFTLTNV